MKTARVLLRELESLGFRAVFRVVAPSLWVLVCPIAPWTIWRVPIAPFAKPKVAATGKLTKYHFIYPVEISYTLNRLIIATYHALVHHPAQHSTRRAVCMLARSAAAIIVAAHFTP
jgi:hypothetical protein